MYSRQDAGFFTSSRFSQIRRAALLHVPQRGRGSVSVGVALADQAGVEVVSVQEDVAKQAPVAVYGISGAVLFE